VKFVVAASVGVICSVCLGTAVANISPEAPINAVTDVHIRKPQEGCRLQVRQGCSLGLKSYRDCHRIMELICEAD
jgi:hypothetical protein